MTKDEILKLKTETIKEATRYLNNAKTMLSEKAGKKDKFYTDAKYVKTACGTAYNGVLIVLDAYIKIKGETYKLPKNGRKSIDYYRQNIKSKDTVLLNHLNAAYDVLHLSGYYEGILKVSTITDGINSLKDIISHFKLKC